MNETSQDAARRATLPTMAQFFVSGSAFGTWGVQIPSLKAHFAVSDTLMSLAMLSVAGGAVIAMKGVGKWVARIGSSRALTLSGLLYAGALLAIPLASHFSILVGVLIAFGVGMSAFDVAMNVQASRVEAARGRPIMSTMHGMFSVGGMTGAAAGGLLLSAGLSLQLYSALMAALLAISAILAGTRPLAHVTEPALQEHNGKGRIPLVLWVLGITAFLGLVCEGAMYDWAALYMRDEAGASIELSSYGYAAFAGGMALGRFAADPLRQWISDRALLTGSAWLGFLGITLAIAVPQPAQGLLGLVMMGLGVANFMPFFFLAGSKIPGMSPAAGVAAVARFAYAGMLFGPPLIGSIAYAATLRAGLVLIALTMGLIAAFGVRQIHKIQQVA